MPVEQINTIYDLAALQAEQEQFLEMLTASKTALTELNNARVGAKGSDLSSFTSMVNALNASMNNAKGATDKVTSSFVTFANAQKVAEANAKALAAAQAKNVQLHSQEAVEVAKLNVQNQAQAKANKEVAQSVLGLIDNYGQLKKQYEAAANSAKNLAAIALKSGNAGDKDAAVAATAQAKALHDSLLKIEQGVGQSQRNVGNYTGAVGVLTTGLAKAKAELDAMSQSERNTTAAGQALTKEVGLLSQLVGQQTHGFTTLRREVMMSTQALAAMQHSGLENTQAYKQLQTVVSDNKRALMEFTEQQKLLAAESPKIAALTAVAKGLGAAYAVGAGAAGLLADGDEKVAERLNKLVAVMTLLQGLSEINKTMTERRAIATALLGTKTAILSGIEAIRNFVMTGSIKAQTESLVVEQGSIAVKEADALATGEVAAATGIATGAMVAFRAALIATGIGALVILLISAVSAMGSFGNKTKDAATDVDILTAALKRQKEELDNDLSDIDLQIETMTSQMKIAGATEQAIQKQTLILLQEKAKEAADFNKMQYDQLNELQKKNDDYNKSLTNTGTILLSLGAMYGIDLGGGNKKKAGDDRSIELKKMLDEQDKAYKDSLKAATDVQLELDKTLMGFKVKNAEASKKGVKETKESLDLEFEIYKITQQRKTTILQQETDDTTKSTKDRLASLENYYYEARALAQKSAEHEIAVEKFKVEELKKQMAEAKPGEKGNIAIEIANENKQIKITQAKLNDDLIGLITDYDKKAKDIYKQDAEAQLKVLDEAEKSVTNVGGARKAAIEASNAQTLASLDKLLKDGKISQEFYDSEKKKSIKNMTLLQLQSDETILEGRREIIKSEMILGKATQSDLDKINSEIDKTKANISSVKNQKDNKPEPPKLEDSLENIGKSTQDMITGLVDTKYQKEIEAIQKIIDLNNIRKDQEINNINASTLSSQEKAAMMITLDNQVAANNHKLAVQQNQIKVKQAKFDRDMAILNIIEQATIAEFKLPAEGGFAGIAAGVAIAVSAAAEIAMLLAKPLPQMPAYAEGTLNHPGGPALAGESGKEMGILPSGKTFMINEPTILTNLPRGSKILSNEMINKAIYNGTIINRSDMLRPESNVFNEMAIVGAIKETGNQTVKALKKQKQGNVILNINGNWGMYITQAVKE